MKINRNLIRNLPVGEHWFHDVEKVSMANVPTHCSFLRKFENKVLTAKTFKDGRVQIIVGYDGQGFQAASKAQQNVDAGSNGTEGTNQG